MRMRLHERERERQIASAFAVVAVVVVASAVVIVVVIVNGIGVNKCVASASVPEVHVLPGQGRQCRTSRGGGVFPRGRRQRWSDPTVVEWRLTVVEVTTYAGMRQLSIVYPALTF
jgi:hypothetical protein